MIKRMLLASHLFWQPVVAASRRAPRWVVAGDSVMAWNRSSGASVADQLEARLGEPVGDVSLPLAQVRGGIRGR